MQQELVVPLLDKIKTFVRNKSEKYQDIDLTILFKRCEADQ